MGTNANQWSEGPCILFTIWTEVIQTDVNSRRILLPELKLYNYIVYIFLLWLT